MKLRFEPWGAWVKLEIDRRPSSRSTATACGRSGSTADERRDDERSADAAASRSTSRSPASAAPGAKAATSTRAPTASSLRARRCSRASMRSATQGSSRSRSAAASRRRATTSAMLADEATTRAGSRRSSRRADWGCRRPNRAPPALRAGQRELRRREAPTYAEVRGFDGARAAEAAIERSVARRHLGRRERRAHARHLRSPPRRRSPRTRARRLARRSSSATSPQVAPPASTTSRGASSRARSRAWANAARAHERARAGEVLASASTAPWCRFLSADPVARRIRRRAWRALGVFGCEGGQALAAVKVDGRVAPCSFVGATALDAAALGSTTERPRARTVARLPDAAARAVRVVRASPVCKGGCKAVASLRRRRTRARPGVPARPRAPDDASHSSRRYAHDHRARASRLLMLLGVASGSVVPWGSMAFCASCSRTSSRRPTRRPSSGALTLATSGARGPCRTQGRWPASARSPRRVRLQSGRREHWYTR